MTGLPPYVSWEDVAKLLPKIFPEGTPNRSYCVRELAASTIFTALYIGAIERAGRYLGPVHVYRMTDEQASKSSDEDRIAYGENIRKNDVVVPGARWYADNTREPIRDETLRDGLVAIGAVTRREDLATTSGAPRYALKEDFAALFDPALSEDELASVITGFQQKHLSKSAQSRLAIVQAGAAGSTTGVLINFPSGETRRLAPGPSSVISKAVIEVFAFRFLTQPAVLWLSESGNKIVVRDDSILNAIGLKIEADRNLPDLILADLAPADPLIVFVEVVATDGPITPRRQEALFAITDSAQFKRSQIAFLTAYQDRQAPSFKKTVHQLAWRSFAWFTSEPEHIIVLQESSESPARLVDLMRG
jgi:hypothetical protein